MKEYILEIKKFLSSEICKKIINYHDEELQTAGIGIGNENRNVRNCDLKNLLLPNTFGEKILSNFIKQKFISVAQEYHRQHSHFKFDEVNQVDFLKYKANNFDAGYIYHIDHGSLASFRSLSISVCLNNNFTGGEFLFDLPEGEIQFPQNVGDVIAFPSNFMFPHQVKKINSGTRYALVGWVI
jgi:predicted 2-oxoglutarate/Fe(II)-dependent dioxygenase YbiX